LDFGLGEVIIGFEKLNAGNPLNALPILARQDAAMRGCYVRS
jgi:hypothetical protein